MTKYSASLGGETYGSTFDGYSREEFKTYVLREVKKFNNGSEDLNPDLFETEAEYPITGFYIGAVAVPEINFEGLAEGVFEQAQEQSDDNDPDDWGDSTFYPAPVKDIDDLASVLKKWFEKHNYKFGYFLIEDAEKVEVRNDGE